MGFYKEIRTGTIRWAFRVTKFVPKQFFFLNVFVYEKTKYQMAVIFLYLIRVTTNINCKILSSYTELQFCLLFCIGVNLSLSLSGSKIG